jgi:hypothetical protein
MRSPRPDVLQPATLQPDTATPGSFALTPVDRMREALRRDYAAMAGTIIAPVPAFEGVIASITSLEKRLYEPVKPSQVAPPVSQGIT